MNKPLKAAIIGSGMIAQTHLTAMRNVGIDVTGIYSLDTESAYQFSQKNKIHQYGTLAALLEDDLDLAAICTPSGTHAEIAIQLMEHHKHAVTEKPVVLTEEEGQMILEAEQRTGMFCAPISQFRFSDAYRTVKDAIDHGDFGTLLLASLSMKYYRSPEYYANSWHGTKAMDGGGALMNQGIHGLDMLCGLLGYPEKISGYAATRFHSIEVEDTAAASFVFPSGMLGVMDAGTAITHAKPRRLEICGSKASITIEEDNLILAEGIDLQCNNESKIRSWDVPSAIHTDLHTAQYRNIVGAILGTEPLYYTAKDAVNTVRVILSIYRSSETGETIHFSK